MSSMGDNGDVGVTGLGSSSVSPLTESLRVSLRRGGRFFTWRKRHESLVSGDAARPESMGPVEDTDS